MSSICEIKKWFTAILTNLNNFHPLEAVDRWRDPQLQVGENYNWTPRRKRVKRQVVRAWAWRRDQLHHGEVRVPRSTRSPPSRPVQHPDPHPGPETLRHPSRSHWDQDTRTNLIICHSDRWNCRSDLNPGSVLFQGRIGCFVVVLLRASDFDRSGRHPEATAFARYISGQFVRVIGKMYLDGSNLSCCFFPRSPMTTSSTYQRLCTRHPWCIAPSGVGFLPECIPDSPSESDAEEARVGLYSGKWDNCIVIATAVVLWCRGFIHVIIVVVIVPAATVAVIW